MDGGITRLEATGKTTLSVKIVSVSKQRLIGFQVEVEFEGQRAILCPGDTLHLTAPYNVKVEL